MDSLIKRRIAPVVRARLSEAPVLLLEGPRGVGKSTLLADLAAEIARPVIDLDQLAFRQLADESPSAVIEDDGPVLIDEYQRVPALLDSIKVRLNRSTSPGLFVLAGSTSFDSLPSGTQALTGRLQRLQIMPFTQAEIDGIENRFVARAFEGDVPHATTPAAATRDDYIQRVMHGGMPLALVRDSQGARIRWFEAHVRQSIERDAEALRRIGRSGSLRGVLARTVGQTGSVLNTTKVAADVKLSWGTASDYITLLESLFLIKRLPAWGVTVLSRTIDAPKVHVVDSGIGAYLLRLSAEKMKRRDPAALTEFGHLLESFVIQEAIRQTTWMDAPVAAGYWRTKDGLEVDLVLERHDGAVVAIEVKTGDHVTGKQLDPLRALRERLGSSFIAGIAFHLGPVGYAAEDRIHVLPVERLWT